MSAPCAAREHRACATPVRAPVIVETAEVDGLRLLGDAVELAPDAEQQLLLEHRVPCAPEPGITSTSLALRPGVRTGSGLPARAADGSTVEGPLLLRWRASDCRLDPHVVEDLLAGPCPRA